jgi:DNA end-binding protein Ku
MAPRANWKGFLRLSLVTCPIALFPATSESEKISFNQINKQTGNRIRYLKVDADTGDEVASEDIIKGYKVDTDRYLEVTKDELENIALESTRTRSTSSCPAARSTTCTWCGLTTSSPTARSATTPMP